ncbi:MAG: carboxylating nicotinate-nucleotide diphosphorylase [Nitrospirota bacterium]|nr:MAG: carboxylating nicotinate-nucleotide diphosphorylase [Nitrospirota bacterium]
MKVPPKVKQLIGIALKEDIGKGDVTSLSTISKNSFSKAIVTSKQVAVVAGLGFFGEVFRQVDPAIRIRYAVKDSQRVRRGEEICQIKGATRGILAAERVALNILQRLCGIATMTSELVKLVSNYDVKVMDTRKTTPCMRYMEKYAVRMGGGANHRFGLYDAVLIKDNHIEAAGGIVNAVQKSRKAYPKLKIEVETGTLKDVKEAMRTDADVIMLDNMSVVSMKKAVKMIHSQGRRPLVEASGNITPKNIRSVASTGVDIISVGSITHSAPSVDLSLSILK